MHTLSQQPQGIGRHCYRCSKLPLRHGKIHAGRSKLRDRRRMLLPGEDDNSINAIKEYIDLLLDSKEEIETTYLLGVLADLQIRQEQYVEAVASLDKSLQLARKNRESFYLAELYRLKACALELGPESLSSGDNINYRLKAEKTAKSQQAKAWLERLACSSEETVN